ncbi:hypothetical protein L198_06077 [Cryptococcus wingfieldii CBS 7118]|uniref:Uncharacterized protein n=1 Tax=Cryptococcus wingfieldii CBS 7118 TaxID=1295528 RepID=A0A1E3ISS9_9TREE|nr:hypothetical protein L198_06077 [Cryptococcus wingfieldii CBS 7118]ODN90761.1 hypothetical protein L198_06077 [Cryptococcus wingfieldii CBS 7118]
MSHYHIFLPPPPACVPPLDSFHNTPRVAPPPLEFHTLSAPPRHDESFQNLSCIEEEATQDSAQESLSASARLEPPSAGLRRSRSPTPQPAFGSGVLGSRGFKDKLADRKNTQSKEEEIVQMPPPSLPLPWMAQKKTSQGEKRPAEVSEGSDRPGKKVLLQPRPPRASTLLPVLPSIISQQSQANPSPHDSEDSRSDHSLGSSFNTTATSTSQAPLPPTAVDGNTSIANFPAWSVPIAKLSSLQEVLRARPEPAIRGLPDAGFNQKRYTLIVCIVSVDSAVERQRKANQGPRSRGIGTEGGTFWVGKWSITSPPVGADPEMSCDVKLWDQCARQWGDEKLKRGDVVLLENVELKPASAREPPHLNITPSTNPKITILFRTIPSFTTASRSDYIYRRPNTILPDYGEKKEVVKGDRQLRPDLRLGKSDVGIRKVGDVVAWFEEWLGVGNGRL